MAMVKARQQQADSPFVVVEGVVLHFLIDRADDPRGVVLGAGLDRGEQGGASTGAISWTQRSPTSLRAIRTAGVRIVTRSSVC